ncbi:hypothetical protein V502_06352 [Pseudogymnoascus sp. VKM F-4520 (FW-2644)]|nr:hypothetical protein V502_06352 [Pseudogymnoascus sp. VKM F-4520 (FW-2644)]
MKAMVAPASASSPAALPIEIGSLSTSSPNESRFFGSSSGVFFVNTVFRAFANSAPESPTRNDPAPDTESTGQSSVNNCIAEQGEDVDTSLEATQSSDGSASVVTKSYGITERRLGQPPSPEMARQLIMSYFEIWHPIFPFLHGPTFLNEVELFYAKETNLSSGTSSQIRENTRRAVLFQSIFNIAALDGPGITLPPESHIQSATALVSFIGILSAKHDTPSLQALLAAQLYLISAMSLPAASTVGGVLLRNMFHAGFHRCPTRYVQLSQHDCDIRKRIFWCAYATDRYLSQALGHPLGIQDSDIDVCVPGTKELHTPVTRPAQSKDSKNRENEVLLHLPDGHPDSEPKSLKINTRASNATIRHANTLDYRSNSVDAPPFLDRPSPSTIPPPRGGQDVLASYVGYCRITGRAIELFHKSIHHRSVEDSKILTLTAEVHAWWNSLPQKLQDLPATNRSLPTHSFAPVFTIIYQQLILLVNRPFLSLIPDTPQFRSSLQTCIGASRIIISTLKDAALRRQCLSAPGILSGTWMAGLVIAFSCELNMYPCSKGFSEIEICLDLLQTMGQKWNSARHCHSVLGILLADLHAQRNKDAPDVRNPSTRAQQLSRGSRRMSRSHTVVDDDKSDKRQRVSSPEYTENDIWGFPTQEQHLLQGQYHVRPDLDDTFQYSPVQTSGQINELQWPDIFGQVSWEALFQGDSGPIVSNERYQA